MQNTIATVFTFAAALAWLRLMDALAQRGLIEHKLSRKLIHIGTGPLFVLCWNLFGPEDYARWLAALVPLAITGQFVAVGLGWMKDETAVKAMTRTRAVPSDTHARFCAAHCITASFLSFAQSSFGDTRPSAF